MDTQTETKQRLDYQEVVAICEQSLKEGLETIALHVRWICVRSVSCRGEGGFLNKLHCSLSCECVGTSQAHLPGKFPTSAGS